ncbi:class II histone deacetylase [Ignatzschineria rhizosphaerae]|uniref:Class II histone deacetylase n=1 Tax=Ignatzschineria rhizosphaerae TaxID=2923279 RepID=A0ABY3X343_9GAMM|nr:class II histone deacetylase [Ignatzschineria rhizosphaerae]UNM97298.1 class II histone deacetylase [Ignatzschineria rhizosphaerae]
MRKTGFYFDESCFWHTATTPYCESLPVGEWVQPSSSGGLAESPESKRRFKNLLDKGGLTQKMVLGNYKILSDEDLMRVHPDYYIEKFKQLSQSGGGELGFNAPIGPYSFEIAKISAGLATQAIEDVWLQKVDNAYALSRPPGHHCLRDEAMGFCVLSNIAIAIEYCREYHGLKRVLVLDWDVHHGNGTQSIYEEDGDIYTISIHQENCFPPGYSGREDIGKGDGLGANLNLPLPAGSGHHAYLKVINEIVIPEIERFKPEIIIIASGFDANALDPLARMLAYSDTYREMTQRICDVADNVCNGKIVAVHEGGYSESYVPFCGVAVVEGLMGHKSPVVDPLISFLKAQQPSEKVEKFLNEYIDELKVLPAK